jgi:hypothetical protein
MSVTNDSPAKPEEFYILSLKWSKGDVLTWWCPDNKGYTIVLDRAGRYTREQVEAEMAYYNDDERTLAIPCGVVEAESVVTVPSCRIDRLRDGYLAAWMGGKND